jgi:hypothetical protein
MNNENLTPKQVLHETEQALLRAAHARRVQIHRDEWWEEFNRNHKPIENAIGDIAINVGEQI